MEQRFYRDKSETLLARLPPRSCKSFIVLPDFHDSSIASLAKQNKLVLSECDSPDCLTWLGKVSDQLASGSVPKLHAAIIAASDHEAIVELR